MLNDAQLDRYMRTRYDSRTYRAFASLPLGVMKADMWRYAVLASQGGVYADADVTCLRPVAQWWDPARCPLLIALENPVHLCQWTLASVPAHPVLRAVVREVVRAVEEDGGVNVSKRGEHFVHYYSGPGRFTKAVLRAIGRPGANHPPAGLLALVGDSEVLRSHGVCIKPRLFFRGQNANNEYASQFLRAEALRGEQRGNASWLMRADQLLVEAGLPAPVRP